MIWINLFMVVLITGYAQWLFYRGWRFFRDLSHTGAAEEVLKIVMEQRHFYFNQGIAGLIALTFFLGVKALLLVFTHPETAAITTFVFGDLGRRFLIVKLGFLGSGLLVTSGACFYQFIKSKHYFEVLYALRGALGLEPGRKISSAPPLASVARQHVA